MSRLLLFLLFRLLSSLECESFLSPFPDFQCSHHPLPPITEPKPPFSNNTPIYFSLSSNERQFLLRVFQCDSPSEDRDLVIRELFGEKSPGCVLRLIQKAYFDGYSLQVIEYPTPTLREGLPAIAHHDSFIFGVFSRLAHCLSVLHENGYVFGHLSPDVILMERNLYPRFFEGSKIKKIGERSAFEGDFQFAAPEVLQSINSKNIEWNSAQDVWSFGVLLHLALFQTLPFSGATPTEYFEDIRNTRSLVIKQETEISFIDVFNKSLKSAKEQRALMSDFENSLTIAIKLFGKYVDRQVSISLSSFTIIEKASLVEMFSEMIFIVILCFMVIPLSVYLISAKINGEEANERQNAAEARPVQRQRELNPVALREGLAMN